MVGVSQSQAKDAPGMRRLVLGQVPPGFDPHSDVAIGAWCFHGAEAAVADWESLPFVEGYADTAATLDDARHVGELALHLADCMVPEMNRRHGVDYGREYWRTLLLPWLLWVASCVLRRYRAIQAFVDIHAGQAFAAELAADRTEWRFRDLFEFHEKVWSGSAFNHWLTSKIVAALAPAHWRLEMRAAAASETGTMAAATPAGRGLRAFLLRIYLNQRCRYVPGVKFSSFVLSAFLAVLPRKARRALREPGEIPADTFPPAYRAVLDEVLECTLPSVLGRDFAAMDAAARRRRFRPGKINLVGPVLMLSEADKFHLAHAAENGELIVVTQHGGSGPYRITGPAGVVEYLQDAYLTWGWIGQGDAEGRFVPLPAPMLQPYRDKARRGGGNILFAGQSLRVFSPKFDAIPLPSHTLAYRQAKCRFLERLDAALLGNIQYRPYPNDPGCLDETAPITARFPTVHIHTGAFDPALLASRLFVTDYIGTPLTTAMVANVPTIVFIDEKMFPICRQAAPVFERLRAAGIAHASAGDAAAFVNRTWPDLEAWWASAEVQTARRLFCAHYARTDRFWLVHWMKALWRL